MVTNRITVETEYHFAGTIQSVRIPKAMMPAFITLVSRGINTWDQAPQEIKDFVDELTGNTKLAKSHEVNAAKFIKQSNGAVIMAGGGGCPDSLKVTAVLGSGIPANDKYKECVCVNMTVLRGKCMICNGTFRVQAK